MCESQVMNATIAKNNGTRPTAVLPDAAGDRCSRIPEPGPELTASAVVAHNAVAIKQANCKVAVIMPEGTSTETGMAAGKPFKVSVAQMLVYELRVRDAMTQSPVTGAPGDSLRVI